MNTPVNLFFLLYSLTFYRNPAALLQDFLTVHISFQGWIDFINSFHGQALHVAGIQPGNPMLVHIPV